MTQPVAAPSDPVPSNPREFHLVLFGATGFTGGLTAEYLARRALEAASSGAPWRWAVAGRSAEKLEAVLSRLRDVLRGELTDLPESSDVEAALPKTIVARIGDPESLRAMAARTHVLGSTVGPFADYGVPVVEACVAEGTHYADITGEPGFVAGLLDRLDGAARDKKVRLVSCCGFDSVPHDLGAWLTVRELPSDRPIRVEGVVRASGTFSGGTWHSAVRAMAKARQTVGALRKGLDAGPGRKVGSTRPKARYEKRLGAWVAPLPTIDPWIVLRTACALPEYGPEFRYGHYVRVKSLPRLALGAAFVGGVSLLAQLPPTRALLLKVRSPGDGPDEATRAKSRFTVYFFGESDGEAGNGGEEVRVEVSGGDPGYDETAKMLGESMLALALDPLPERFGLLSPAAAMGDALLARLRDAGMRFEVVQGGGGQENDGANDGANAG